jgi:CRISPR system Cascade subunit CasA
MKRAGLSVALAAVSLAACAHYAPAPPQLDRFPAELDARRLEAKPPGVGWSGADLLAAALARNPRVAEAKAKYLTAAAAARTAKLTPPLTLTLTAEYASERPRWGYGAAADVPIDAGARRSARMSTADLQALQAWYDYAEAAWAVRTALEKARIDLASAEGSIPFAERAASLRRDRLQRLERRVAAGEDDRVLALTAQTELSAAERKLVDTEGRRQQAKVDLATALGVSPIAVSDLALAPPPEVPALDMLPAWRRDAALTRRDVLRALADYDLAETALRLEVAKQYPEVRIGPGYFYDHGVDKLPFNLALTLPPYDLNRSAIAQAEAARAAAGRSLEAVQANVLGTVDGAQGALATARANLDRVTQRALPAARRTAEGATRSLEAGGADRVEELAAQAAVLDTELDLRDARRATAMAAADLEDALRRPFDPAEANALPAAPPSPGGTP